VPVERLQIDDRMEFVAGSFGPDFEGRHAAAPPLGELLPFDGRDAAAPADALDRRVLAAQIEALDEGAQLLGADLSAGGKQAGRRIEQGDGRFDAADDDVLGVRRLAEKPRLVARLDGSFELPADGAADAERDQQDEGRNDEVGGLPRIHGFMIAGAAAVAATPRPGPGTRHARLA
jgi:hypothetical protein